LFIFFTITTAENGEKYLYILSDGIPDDKTMVTADITTVNEQFSSGVALVENVDKNKELEKLKQIEDRSSHCVVSSTHNNALALLIAICLGAKFGVAF
jgi:uncharacterized protein YegL